MQHVTKHYRRGGGIVDVNLEVDKGEILAFLGPNGAGKTTTIRLLLDLIRPDSGQISIFGLDTRRHSVEVRKHIGYLPGELGLYERLTARELLTHFAHLRRGPSWPEINAIAECVELEVDRPIRTLSKGNRQKVGLVQALMGHPQLLILDEPTAGLDPLIQYRVVEMLREAAACGNAVFLSSHNLSEVEGVAHRVAMIRDGQVVSIDNVEDLRTRAIRYVTVRLPADVEAAELFLPDATLRSTHGRRLEFEVSGSIDKVIKALAQCTIEDVTIREPSLEEFFLSAFGVGSPIQRDEL